MKSVLHLPQPAPENSPSPRPVKLAPNRDCDCSQEGEFDIKKIDSLKFLVQVTITAFMLLLCWGGLQTAEKDSDRVIYWGGITGIIGWWMPSPNGSKTTRGSEK